MSDIPDTKPCECGKVAVLCDTGITRMTYPVQHERAYWCKCGVQQYAPPRIEKTAEQLRLMRWEAANP